MTSGAPGAVRAVTRLLLIRHAETEANATGRTQGRLDLPLTARGAAQAAAVAESIAAHAPVAVFASPARRAVETAEAIAMRCGVGVRLDERLLEMDHGDLDGLTGEELRAAAPELLERWRVDPSEVRMPGGETLQEAQRRMLAAADATMFDPELLFGEKKFDRVVISYALSMIADWKEVLLAGAHLLSPRGTLYVVDFSDQSGLPGWFRKALRSWLARFSVTPRDNLADQIAVIARMHGYAHTFRRIYKGYAAVAEMTAR